jgi:hypothetical protein
MSAPENTGLSDLVKRRMKRKVPDVSDTPRTDAEWRLNGVREDGREYVNLEFARDLERECKRLDEGLNRACDRLSNVEISKSRPSEWLKEALHNMGTHSPVMLEVLGEHLSTAQAEDVLRLTMMQPQTFGGAMKFASHCPDGQKCGATTTGCMEGECQRDPRQSQPKCHSCGGWVKVEEGGICLPCHTEDSRDD